MQNSSGLSVEKQQLEATFQVFNQVSERLVDSYQQLQIQVARMSEELAVAHGERLAQLAEKEHLANRIKKLLETLPAAVVVLDGEGRVQQYNPAACELFPGLRESGLWQELYRKHFRPGQRDEEQWLNSGRLVNLIERSLEPEPGKILLLLDVTEARRLQARAEQQQRLSTMGKVAAQLAHQIRTPLSSAILYTSHLGRSDLSEHQRHRFSKHCSDRLRHIERQINDMLAFARGTQIEAQPVNIASLLDELVQNLEPMLNEGGVTLELPGEHGPDLWVNGNREALLGALMNLAVNALEQGGDGLHLSIETVRCEDSLHLYFKDNGPGIPADLQSKIFDPFFTTRSDGTGLGLAVVETVILSHHGQISVRSLPGIETCFQITLPLTTVPQSERRVVVSQGIDLMRSFA